MEITNEKIREQINLIYTRFDAVLNPYAKRRSSIPNSLYEDIGWNSRDYDAVDNLVREVYQPKHFTEKLHEVSDMLNRLKASGIDIRSDDVIYDHCPAIIKMCIYYMAYIYYRKSINGNLAKTLLEPLKLPSDILIMWHLSPRYDFLSQYCEHYYEVRVPETRCKCTNRKKYILDIKHYELLYKLMPKHWQCTTKSKDSPEVLFQKKIKIVKQLIAELKSSNKKIIYPPIIRRVIYVLIYDNYAQHFGKTAKEILEELNLRKNLLTKWNSTPEQDWIYDSYSSADNPIQYMGKKIFPYNFMVRNIVYNLPYIKNADESKVPPIHTFIDVFGGSGNVTYTLPPLPYHVERVYNDKDLYVSNFFYVIHTYPEEYKAQLPHLVEFVQTANTEELFALGRSSFKKEEVADRMERKVLIARGIYKECVQFKKAIQHQEIQLKNKEEMLKAALAFTYQYSFKYKSRPSISGIKKPDDILNFIKGIPEWEHMTDIFKKVDCRCDDAIEIINSYIDDDKVLFYLDSPYIATTQYDEAYSDKDDDKKDEADNKKNDEAPDKEENTADEEYVAETPDEEAPDEEDIDDDEMSLGDFTKMRDALKKCKGKWIFSCRPKANTKKDADNEYYYDPEQTEQIYQLLKQYEGTGKYVVYLATKGMRDELEFWGSGLLEIMIVNFKPAIPDIEIARRLNITNTNQLKSLKSEYRVLEYSQFLKLVEKSLVG